MTDYYSIKEKAKEFNVPFREALNLRRHYLTREIQIWTDLINECRNSPFFGKLEKKLAQQHIDRALKELVGVHQAKCGVDR